MTGDKQRLTSRVDAVQRGRSRYTVIRVPEELAAAARAPVVDGPFLWAGATLLRRPRAEPGNRRGARRGDAAR